MTAEVVGERGNGGVATAGLLAKRGENDGIEVPADQPAQLARGHGARAGGVVGRRRAAAAAAGSAEPGSRVTAELGRSGSVVHTAAATSWGARLGSRYGERPVSSS